MPAASDAAMVGMARRACTHARGRRARRDPGARKFFKQCPPTTTRLRTRRSRTISRSSVPPHVTEQRLTMESDSSSSCCVDLPAHACPPGLQYREAASTPAQWQALEGWLAADASIPWEVATEGRRVAQWGYRYDYGSHMVDTAPVEPIPHILTQLLHAEPEPERFTQCIINEYGADDGENAAVSRAAAAAATIAAAAVAGRCSNAQIRPECVLLGIPYHKDDAAFGDTVLVFSFGEPRTLRLRRLASGAVAAQAPGDAEAQPEQPTQVVHEWEVTPAHGSAYMLEGAARNDYQHSVQAGQGLRYSVTFRSNPDLDRAGSTAGARL